MNRKWIIQKIVFLFTAAVLLSACGGAIPGDGTYVWIDVPVSGLTVPIGQSIQVEGHATSSSGIARVEIWVNGALTATVNSLPTEGDLARFNFDWTPPGAGEYTIQVVSFDNGGAMSEPDATRIYVGDLTAAPVITVTPIITVTPVIIDTPTSLPGAVIQFWAEPSEIQAGDCTTIRWHAENVQGVVFGGIQQQLDGSYQDCLCSNQRYTLTVTHLDGSEEKRTVDINVTDSCITPEPPPPAEDTTPPPVPSPNTPSNGQELSCRKLQTLAWSSVTDDSDISGYYVKLEIQVKQGEWQSAGGYGPVTGNQVNANVQCGGIYRWLIRAQDGAGNFSNWSAPSTFSITMN